MKNVMYNGVETMLDNLIEMEYNALMLVEKANNLSAKELNKVTRKMKKEMKKANKNKKKTEKSLDSFYGQVAKIWG